MRPKQMDNTRRSTPRMRKANGFTLIEVLLVLIILVVLGALATNVFTGTRDKANINAAQAQIGLLSSAINLYQLHMNRFPNKLEDLWVEPSDADKAEKWGGPYLEKLKLDPWENEYQYTAEGKHNKNKYDFWSNGPDGKSGTDDDIGNWEK